AVVHVEETKSAREIVLENKEDPSDAAIDGEHLDAVGHPDENKGPNEKEDPSDAAVDGEHMDVVGHPDLMQSDVLMTDAPDTINLADPPSHESEITSPCSSEKKGDGLDRAKANQVILTYNMVLYLPRGCSSIVEYRKGRGLWTGFVTFYDTLNGLESWQKENLDWWLSLRVMMIEQLPQGMPKHGIFKKKDIDPERYNITFEFSNHALKQDDLYGDCGVWVRIYQKYIKTVKNKQARTRESEENKKKPKNQSRSQKSQAPVNMVNSSKPLQDKTSQ
ncbi:hypothetical protein Tco_1355942, partial [Tanacetum coccineum]